MKPLRLLAFLLLLPLCAVAGNPRIAEFVKNLGDPDSWKNGLYWPIHVGASASPKDVIDAYIKTDRGVDRFITQYDIIATEKVAAPMNSLSGDYTAVLIKSNLGDMIVLMENNGADWWVKVFNIK